MKGEMQGVLPGLRDDELRAVMDAAASLPIEKRNLYLIRLTAFRRLNRGSIDAAIRYALRGLQYFSAIE
jgi:hypothetical protein